MTIKCKLFAKLCIKVFDLLTKIWCRSRSKVSTRVSSNLKGCAGAIKEETEALGTIAQQELDHVVDTICCRVPFFVRWNHREHATDDPSSTRSKESCCDEEFMDAQASQSIEDKTVEEESQQDHVRGEMDKKLHHDPLCPPGRIIYLNRAISSGPLTNSTAADNESSTTNDVVEIAEVATDDFSRVVLSNRMLLDHLCTDYEQVLQSQAKLLQPPPDSAETAQ